MEGHASWHVSMEGYICRWCFPTARYVPGERGVSGSGVATPSTSGRGHSLPCDVELVSPLSALSERKSHACGPIGTRKGLPDGVVVQHWTLSSLWGKAVPSLLKLRSVTCVMRTNGGCKGQYNSGSRHPLEVHPEQDRLDQIRDTAYFPGRHDT